MAQADKAVGDTIQFGQAIFPVPSEDPNDPLQVSLFVKQTTVSSLIREISVVPKEEERDFDPLRTIFFPCKLGCAWPFGLHQEMGSGL